MIYFISSHLMTEFKKYGILFFDIKPKNNNLWLIFNDNSFINTQRDIMIRRRRNIYFTQTKISKNIKN
jgi:hypothetical protein